MSKVMDFCDINIRKVKMENQNNVYYLTQYEKNKVAQPRQFFFTYFLNHTPVFGSVYGITCLHRMETPEQ